MVNCNDTDDTPYFVEVFFCLFGMKNKMGLIVILGRMEIAKKLPPKLSYMLSEVGYFLSKDTNGSLIIKSQV